MRVLVSDTSALVDLERGSLLDATFRMPFQFTVPDLLYDRELKNHGGDRLRALGLRIAELDGDGVMQALEYRHQHPALSLPDCFAFTLAASGDWILLTGDRELRRLAVSEHVKCHGVLWLMDMMLETASASAEVRERLVEALNLDLIGPGVDHALASECLPGWVRPSNWYLTGFLIPAGAPPEQSADADEEDDLDETPDAADRRQVDQRFRTPRPATTAGPVSFATH